MTEFHLDLYDKNGDRQAILNDVRFLSYSVKVNSPGKVVFTLSGDLEIAKGILPGWRCDVWRKLPTGTWRKEMISFVNDWDWTFTDRPEMTFTGSGVLSLLEKRIVAWYANTANRSYFYNTRAETIAKTLVSYNLGGNATTTNGRLVNGVRSDISVELDGNSGNNVEWFCAWQNLLKTLQELSKPGGIDFDIVPVGNLYEFRTYIPRIGTDRTDNIVFSLERGNIANPRQYLYTGESANIAIVGGKGEEAEREVEVVSLPLNRSPFDSEVFVQATDVDTTAGLAQRGADKLAGMEATPRFEFDVLQAENARWNVDYFLGDLVKVITPMEQTPTNAKIDSATVTFDESGKEKIEIGVDVE